VTNAFAKTIFMAMIVLYYSTHLFAVAMVHLHLVNVNVMNLGLGRIVIATLHARIMGCVKIMNVFATKLKWESIARHH